MKSFFQFKTSRFNPLITIAVVVIWLILFGMLIKDQYYWGGSEITETFRLAAAESDDWFLIRIRGSNAGFGRSRQYQNDDGWALKDNLKISLNIQGQLKPVTIISNAVVDKKFRLKSFDLKVASGIISFGQKGRMEGRNLIVRSPDSLGGGARKIKLFEAPRISRSLGLPAPLTGLKVGDEMKIPIFDPLDGQKWDAFIRVEDKANLKIAGNETEAWLVKAFFRKFEANMWIDEEGRLLKGRLPLGITVTRATKEEIKTAMAGIRDLPEMMGLASVPVEGNIPEPRSLKHLKLRIVKGGDLRISSDTFRQKKDNTEIEVNRERLPKSTYTLPNMDSNLEQYLTASMFIRSDHQDIIDKAKEIVGDEKDPVKAAQLINTWVYKNLRKIPTPSVPDALSVLYNRQGDCNEHAVLSVALARAIGLPAKIALGLVFLEDGFYYHAWCTYWAGDKWFTADPLINQLPVDASHVALLYGDVDKHTNVISYLGKLKLKILDAN